MVSWACAHRARWDRPVATSDISSAGRTDNPLTFSESNDNHLRRTTTRDTSDLTAQGGSTARRVPTASRTPAPLLASIVDEATGRGHRRDPVEPRTGGPAGNARLTAWVGLLLLVLTAGELVTLLDVLGLIDWHVGIGITLTAFALLKTVSTGWRILRYYTGAPAYGIAGPPPLLLRLLGPLVIAATLGVLGSGIALIIAGPVGSRQPWITVAGRSLSLVTLHAGFFILFAVFAGLHVLARFIPALSLATGRPSRGAVSGRGVPGKGRRTALLVGTCLAAAAAVVLVLPSVHGWQHQRHVRRDHVPAAVGAHA